MAWDEAKAWMSGALSERLYQDLLDDAVTAPVRMSVNDRRSPRPLRVGRVLAFLRWISRCSGNAASLSPGAMNPSRRLASVKTRPRVAPLSDALTRSRLYAARSAAPSWGQATTVV